MWIQRQTEVCGTNAKNGVACGRGATKTKSARVCEGAPCIREASVKRPTFVACGSAVARWANKLDPVTRSDWRRLSLCVAPLFTVGAPCLFRKGASADAAELGSALCLALRFFRKQILPSVQGIAESTAGLVLLKHQPVSYVLTPCPFAFRRVLAKLPTTPLPINRKIRQTSPDSTVPPFHPVCSAPRGHSYKAAARELHFLLCSRQK